MRLVLSFVLACSLAASAEAGGCFGRKTSHCCSAPCNTGCAPVAAPCNGTWETVMHKVCVPEMKTEKRIVEVCTPVVEHRQVTRTVHKCVTEEVEQSFTVMVPVTEEREIRRKVCKPVVREVERTYEVMIPVQEERESTKTVCEAVTKEVEETYTVMVPTTEEREITRTVCKPVVEEKEETFTVLVPTQEQRMGTRTIRQMVPVKKTRKVCQDQGHWEERTVEVACGPCRKTTRTCRVWVPKLVETEVEYCVHECQTKEEQYTWNVTVCKPETRTRKVCVTKHITEEVKEKHTVTVCRPETRTRKVHHTEYVQKTVPCKYTVTVCKPETAPARCR